ncbi:MAG: hypothetical protein NC324_02545 [Bacteroides sp.]|nr:hypothetical protein [Bacteroides sp.]
MSLKIQRKKDNRVVKCILHRVADIPGGVAVSVAGLGGSDLFEGTPLAVGKDGLYVVVKTAQIVTEATATATTYEVAKGHHFQVGDHFATADCAGQIISKIDKTDASKDVITLAATLGAEVAAGTCAFESDGNGKELKNVPVAIAGSNYSIEDGDNLFVDAWVIGVVRKANAPVVNDAIAEALKCIVYV